MLSPSPTPWIQHARHHRSILATVEKRALIRIAEKLPRRINSDHLSALGLGSMCLAGGAFALFRWSPWWAFAVVAALAMNWFGDSLDGTVARVRGHERPRYGFYVDHVIDVAGTSALLAGLGVSGIMHPVVAASVLAAYLLVSAESYLATHSLGVFRISFFGIGPTELRILLAAGALRCFVGPDISLPGIGQFQLFDVGGAVAAGALVVVFIASAVRNTATLYAAEPLPAFPDQARPASPSRRTATPLASSR